MAIITFWSNGKEETAKTLSIASIATYMALKNEKKHLILSTNYNDNTLESCFEDFNKNVNDIADKNKESSIHTGIEGLSKILNSNKGTPEKIKDYTKIVFRERLEILYGFINEDYNEYMRVKPLYKEIIRNANKYYDYVFVDLNKGLDMEDTKEILKMSDLIVVNLTQRLKIIDSYIELKKQEPIFQNANTIVLLGRYDKNSKYNTKNVTRHMDEKTEVSAIPYNTLFFESCNEGKVAEYFIRNRSLDPLDRNAVFINQIDKTAETILSKIR